MADHKIPSADESTKLAHDLGALFLNFGVLDHTLSRAVAAALGLTELQENTLVRGMYPRQKLELLSAHAKKHWNDKSQKELAKVSKDVFALIDYRNDFAHGVILHDKHGKWNVISFRGADRFHGKAEPIDLKLLATRLSDAIIYAEVFEKWSLDMAAGKHLRPAAPPKPHHPK